MSKALNLIQLFEGAVKHDYDFDLIVGYAVDILNNFKKSMPKQDINIQKYRSLFNREDMKRYLDGVLWEMYFKRVGTKHYKNLEQYFPKDWDDKWFPLFWSNTDHNKRELIYKQAITKFHKQLKADMHKKNTRWSNVES